MQTLYWPCRGSYLFIFLKYLFIYLFIYLWLCWVFVSVRGFSLVPASGGHSSSRCAGLSLSQPLLLRSTGSRRAGSVVVAHGPSCSAACGIFPDKGSNPCPLHWQADSLPLRHQGSLRKLFFLKATLRFIIGWWSSMLEPYEFIFYNESLEAGKVGWTVSDSVHLSHTGKETVTAASYTYRLAWPCS